MSTAQIPPTPASPSFPEPYSPSCSSCTSDVSSPTLLEWESTSAYPKSLPTEHADPPQNSIKEPSLFTRRCVHLLRPLAPLLSIETGLPHPHFPPTLLHYHLLTQRELDELARFYHQYSPSSFSTHYPMPVITRWKSPPDANDSDIDDETMNSLEKTARILGTTAEETSSLKSKRRRFGRFMGLQGMESADATKESTMMEEMDRWVDKEMAIRDSKAREVEALRAKMIAYC